VKNIRRRSLRLSLTALCLLPALACGNPDSGAPPAEALKNETPAPRRDVFLFLGDSLTAGYGVAQDEAYPALLERKWKKNKIPFHVKNAGVSGSTSKGVLENLDWNLTENVHTVFLAVGANDGLRGQDLAKTEENIDGIVKICRSRGIRVVLAGMKIPPNYGAAYAENFSGMFRRVARNNGLKLMPFLLEDVAARPDLNISDGIHPNALGHAKMAENVHRFLSQEGLLR